MKIGDLIVPKKIYANSHLRPIALIVGNDNLDAYPELPFAGVYNRRYKVLVQEHVVSWTVYYCRKYFKALKK